MCVNPSSHQCLASAPDIHWSWLFYSSTDIGGHLIRSSIRAVLIPSFIYYLALPVYEWTTISCVCAFEVWSKTLNYRNIVSANDGYVRRPVIIQQVQQFYPHCTWDFGMVNGRVWRSFLWDLTDHVMGVWVISFKKNQLARFVIDFQRCCLKTKVECNKSLK